MPVLIRLGRILGQLIFIRPASPAQTRSQSWKLGIGTLDWKVKLSLCLLSFRLEEFEFSEGCRRLGLDVANFIIQRCPNLRRISRLRSWGRVSRKQVMTTISLFSPIPYLPEISKPSIFLQLDAVKTEVLLRNFDLVIDNGWNSIGWSSFVGRRWDYRDLQEHSHQLQI